MAEVRSEVRFEREFPSFLKLRRQGPQIFRIGVLRGQVPLSMCHAALSDFRSNVTQEQSKTARNAERELVRRVRGLAMYCI
jgi:hypothetical protein